jgi:hypothetical protein
MGVFRKLAEKWQPHHDFEEALNFRTNVCKASRVVVMVSLSGNFPGRVPSRLSPHLWCRTVASHLVLYRRSALLLLTHFHLLPSPF